MAETSKVRSAPTVLGRAGPPAPIRTPAEDTTGVIGRGLFIKGELHGEEDLIIEGRVEGEITLKKHLVIGEAGVVIADIHTENITIRGEMKGQMVASERVEIQHTARVVGDIKAPRVVVEEGAKYKGRIDMGG